MTTATITPAQISRVRETFAVVAPRTDDLAMRFYGRLFNLAPETRGMFQGDMATQGRKLFQTLAAVIDGLDMLDQIVPLARALAIRHVGYGVQPRHYRIVGAALMDTLRGALGNAFDDETEAAWEAAYALLSEEMLAATGARA